MRQQGKSEYWIHQLDRYINEHQPKQVALTQSQVQQLRLRRYSDGTERPPYEDVAEDIKIYRGVQIRVIEEVD